MDDLWVVPLTAREVPHENLLKHGQKEYFFPLVDGWFRAVRWKVLLVFAVSGQPGLVMQPRFVPEMFQQHLAKSWCSSGYISWTQKRISIALSSPTSSSPASYSPTSFISSLSLISMRLTFPAILIALLISAVVSVNVPLSTRVGPTRDMILLKAFKSYRGCDQPKHRGGQARRQVYKCSRPRPLAPGVWPIIGQSGLN